MIKLNNPAIEPWMEELWAWADENCLSEQDIPRNTSDLVNLQKFSSTIYISETEQTLRYINPLPKAFSNLKNLKHLDLSNSNLKSVPAFMMELINLEIFKINNNKIKTLPKTINKLVKLKLLDISNNKNFKSLPESIKYLEKLEHLNLGGNYNLEKLPEFIGDFNNLIFLHYSSSLIKKLPESINLLNNLIDIEITDYRKNEFPEFIFNQKNLLNLSLTVIDDIDSGIPNALQMVTQFKYLESLNLSSVGIETIPDNFNNLKNIRHLDLASNYNIKINKSLFDLPSLEYLNLRNCGLTELPENIGNLTKLNILNLESNKLIHLPSNINNLQSLEELYLYDNKIKCLPESIGKLEKLIELRMSGNKLKYLPESISSITTLKYLDCSNNELISLPDSLGSMLGLKKLDCAYNKLTTLPDSISKLRLVEEIDIRHNPINTLPNSLNKITSLEDFWVPINNKVLSPQVLQVLSEMSNVSIIGLDKNLEMLNNSDKKTNIVTIQISGTSVETFGGTVEFKTYKYFEDNGIDINDYSHAISFNVDELSIPNEHNFGKIGIEEMDDLWHINGAYLDIEDNELKVIDKNNSNIWRSSLNSKYLEDQGVKVICDGDFDEIVNKLPTPLAVVIGRYISNGIIFETTIKLTEEFDANKLIIYYYQDDGGDIIKKIEYDEKIIEDESSSSYEQSREFSWFTIKTNL